MPITVRVKAPASISTLYSPQRAVLRINGEDYYEWKSVQVRHAIFESPPFTFQFTCSEQTPFAEDFAALRIRPPDKCEVYLDGQLAIVGEVVTRQVYFDKGQHQVQIQGIGRSGILSYGGVLSQTREWTNVDITELATAVAEKYGINVVTEGGVSGQKFPRCSAAPNDRAWDFLERYARAAGVMMTSNPQGDLVLISTAVPGADVMVEGGNILTGREIIHSLSAGQQYLIVASKPGDNDVWGAIANQFHAGKDSSDVGDAGMPYLPRVIMSEIPAFSIDQLQRRLGLEDHVDQGNQITVELTSLGWQRPSGGLWQVSQQVVVKSPMLILDDSLILRAVTFSQDNTVGTISTLDLVNQTALSGFEQTPGGAGVG